MPGGCAAGSAQELWLRADLAANSGKNVIAIWHKPRFSSGVTNLHDLQALYDDIYAFGVDILLDGHDHIYERLAPMDPSGAGRPDLRHPPVHRRHRRRGAASHAGTLLATSQACNGATYGVMKLTLHASTYDWQFLPIAGSTFTDAGTGSVHARTADTQRGPRGRRRCVLHAARHAQVVAAPGVLGNDTDGDADPLTAILNTDVSHGVLTLNANGSFSYTPTPATAVRTASPTTPTTAPPTRTS